MTAGNSPLENPKLSWDDMIKGKKPFETHEQRKIRFEKLIKKIEESEADASIARGYASLDVTATTSGQVTDLKLPNSQEEIYTSWIGDAIYTYQRGTIYEEDVIIVAYNLLTDEVLVKNLDGVIWAPIHRCNLTYKSDIEKDSLITSFSDITDDSLKEALQVKSDTKKSFIQGTYFNSKIVHNKLKFNFKDENNQI